jgi:hypothetical protein
MRAPYPFHGCLMGTFFQGEYPSKGVSHFTAKMILESEITKAILKDLRSMGVFCFKHWGGPMGTKGVSDILGVLPGGRFLALEVKTEKGKLTPGTGGLHPISGILWRSGIHGQVSG